MTAPSMAEQSNGRHDTPRQLVRLDVGEPDAPTPPHVVEAGVRALRDGATRYVAAEGIAPLRDAIATHLRARGHDATPGRVLVTSGAKPMLVDALLALLRAGDEALIPDPGYPGYRVAVSLAGATAVPYPVMSAEGDFSLDVDAIAACVTPRTRVLVLNTPHNPTGGIATSAELDALATLALRHDLHVVSDEVYSAIVYDGPAPAGIGTRPGMAERTITIDSFSKTYAMTGWRLGYGLAPAALVPRLRSLILGSATCTPEFVQRAGVAALTGPQECVGEMVGWLRERRAAMLGALATIPGVHASSPAGALYAFARLPGDAARDSAATARRLHDEAGLICAPGSAYGARGEGHLRLSFAVSPDVLHEGVTRLAHFLA